MITRGQVRKPRLSNGRVRALGWGVISITSPESGSIWTPGNGRRPLPNYSVGPHLKDGARGFVLNGMLPPRTQHRRLRLRMEASQVKTARVRSRHIVTA